MARNEVSAEASVDHRPWQRVLLHAYVSVGVEDPSVLGEVPRLELMRKRRRASKTVTGRLARNGGVQASYK